MGSDRRRVHGETPRDGRAAKGGRFRANPLIVRSLWTFVGQTLSSASNFAVGVVILTTASRTGYAAFAVGLTTYLLVTQLNRSVVSLPVLMLHSAEIDPRIVADRAEPAAAVAMVTGAVGAAILAVAGLAFPSARGQFLVFALFLPLLQYQDLVRHAAFAAGRPSTAAASDGLWLALQAVLSLGAVAADRVSPTALLFAWTSAGAVSGAIFGARLRLVPRFSSCRRWLGEHRLLCRRLFAEFLVHSGSYYLLCYGLALLTSADQLGRLRAAQSLMGPVSVVLLGANALGVPESVRVRHEEDQLRRFAIVLSGGLALVSAVGGLVVYVSLPIFGPALFPKTWAMARPVIPVLSAYGVAVGAATGALAALRARPDVSWIVRARGRSGIVTLLVGLPAAFVYGANGALAGLVLAETVTAVAAWVRLRPAARPPEHWPEAATDFTPPALA